MKRRYIGLAMGALMVAGAALSLPSCGHDQKLVGVQITPTSFTFLTPNPAGKEQYTAVASYIHPPAMKDVTSIATWAIDDGVVTINQGLASPVGTSCGGGTISATMPEGTGGSSNIVRGFATVTVNNPADTLCPGGGTIATLSVGVSGAGTVASVPAGINCPAACAAEFNVNSSVLLTATLGGGSTSVSWGGCTASSSNQCTVTIPTGGAAVLATFQ